MDFGLFLNEYQVHLLVFGRIIAVLMVAPLVSSQAIPGAARVGMALMCTWIMRGMGFQGDWVVPDDAASFMLLLAGEVMIGIIIGFFLQIVYAGFQTAGQFFSIQMGFGASEVFDPLSNEELPLMGQYFNLVAMYVFLSCGGMHKLFFQGLQGSFQAIRAQDFVTGQRFLSDHFLGALGSLFAQALVLAFPVMGTLFLISVAMGLMAKAAPQMNLLSMGFPINMLVAFLLLTVLLPPMINIFTAMVDAGFNGLDSLFLKMAGQMPATVAPAAGGTVP